MTMCKVPLIIRGEVIEDTDVEYGGRNPETRFRTADVRKYIDRLPLSAPSALADCIRSRSTKFSTFWNSWDRACP